MTYPSRKRKQKPSRWLIIRYAGKCSIGGERLPAGSSAYYNIFDHTLVCSKLEHADKAGLTKVAWHGSPIRGGWVRELSDRRLGELHNEADRN